jgi:lipopolysaccharide/colanic/teichoic acid biosynthesis glycosyltransferase
VVVIPSQPRRPRPGSPTGVLPSAAKSVLDRTVAAGVLLLTSVCLALVALAVWLDDDGPLLVRERRLGRHGRAFELLRFRTSAWVSPTADQPARPPASPSRTGAVLVRWNLDRLPALVNVVKGDLSLVGPRPRRLVDGDTVPPPPGVRPGLVRPWQAGIAPRSPAEEARAVEDYLRNWSPATDLVLLARILRGAVGQDRP